MAEFAIFVGKGGGWGTFARRFSVVYDPNFTKLGPRAIIADDQICFRVKTCYCIFKCGGAKLSDIENDPKFCTF